MGLGVLRHDHGLASRIGARYSFIAADILMVLHFSPFEFEVAAFFKETLSFVRAFNYLERAIRVQVVEHLPSLYAFPTVVSALDFKVDARIFDVIIDLYQRQVNSTVEDTRDKPIRAFVALVVFQGLSDYLPTIGAVRAVYRGVLALLEVALDISDFRHLLARFVWAGN